MKRKIVFLFSGQGSQYYNMGIELYKNNQVFRYWIEKLDEIYYDQTGLSIIKELYERNNPRKVFNNLIYTHPAIFMMEYALGQAFIEEGIFPDYVLGSSIGEFVAASVSGVISYEVAIKSLIQQAKLIIKYCSKGRMVSVLDQVDLYYKLPVLNENSTLIAVNFSNNFTISYLESNAQLIEEALKKHNLSYNILPVKYGFHSQYINEIEKNYKEDLSVIQYKSAKIPIISCVSGKIENNLYKDYLWDAITRPVLFSNAVDNLLLKESKLIFVDLGPSGTLANFTKYNLKNKDFIETYTIMTPFNKDLEHFNDTIEKLYEKKE
ncbi:acyltransferase domain-containing protein [Clostridium estertheticum]|uniref:acyltransferase domain-containing protein n=1 Tax=Clostridium estertheticum TaxID=238834 RepID=UPI0013EE5780|nr:acyltransferase domain-containing protein [Clostridium estertheticum]MBZ9609910.1 acyltransferase domain-containing protein [Clostridium estertheticum]